VAAGQGELAHLPVDVRPIAALPDEDRIAHIRAERWIRHAAAERVLGDLQEAFDQAPCGRMENVLLLGESGMGKSMLLGKFERANAVPFDEASGAQPRPVLVVPMPPVPTEAEFFECVLEAIGAPWAGYQRQGPHLRASAMRLLGEMGVRVLVIDEINSVLAGTPRQQRLFLQLLRFFSNGLRAALVCAGVPEARHTLLSDPQLRSRFSDVELPAWAAGEDLRDFVNRLTWSLPLRQPSPVDSPRLRMLLADRSQGVTLGICKAVERAAIAAIRNGRERIDLASFADPEVWRGVAAIGQRKTPQFRAAGRAGLGVTWPASLPLAPRPLPGEAVLSWVRRIAARYELDAPGLIAAISPAGMTVHPSRIAALDRTGEGGLDQILAVATRLDGERIGTMRPVAEGTLQPGLLYRLRPAWCNVCLHEDAAQYGEVYERAIWRLGWCVICPVHQRPLLELCPYCVLGQCCLQPVTGRQRLVCDLCREPVDVQRPSRRPLLPDTVHLSRGGPTSPEVAAATLALQTALLAAVAGCAPAGPLGFGLDAATFLETVHRLAMPLALPLWSEGRGADALAQDLRVFSVCPIGTVYETLGKIAVLLHAISAPAPPGAAITGPTWQCTVRDGFSKPLWFFLHWDQSLLRSKAAAWGPVLGSYVLHALDAVDGQARQQVAEAEQRKREAAWTRMAVKRSAADLKRIMAARARRAARARLKRKRCERSSSNAGLRWDRQSQAPQRSLPSSRRDRQRQTCGATFAESVPVRPSSSARSRRCLTDDGCQRVPPRGVRSRMASSWDAICCKVRSGAAVLMPATSRTSLSFPRCWRARPSSAASTMPSVARRFTVRRRRSTVQARTPGFGSGSV